MILVLILPEKIPTHFTYVNMQNMEIGNRERKKMDKNIKRRVITLNLYPMIQSLILHMFTKVEDSSLMRKL